jgi:hypothetical protein
MAVTNPLEGITHFFVNPRMIDGFKQLNLDKCCYKDKEVLGLSEGLPILWFPLEALELDKAIVTLDDNGRNGKIKTDSLTIYFNKEAEPNTIRINTVLGSKPRKIKIDDIRISEIVKSIVKEETIW